MASRRPRWPNGCRAPAIAQEGWRHSRSSSLAHRAKGKAARSGWPVGKAIGDSSNDRVDRRGGETGRCESFGGTARQDGRARVGRTAAGGDLGRHQHLVRQVGRDREARRRLRHHVALGHELVDGRQDRAARAAELRRHQPRGGQPEPRRQAAVEDGGADLLADLPVQRHVGRGIEGEAQRGGLARHDWSSLFWPNWLFRIDHIGSMVRPNFRSWP